MPIGSTPLDLRHKGVARPRTDQLYVKFLMDSMFLRVLDGNNIYLGGGFKKILFFTPKIGEMIPFDQHIFQMGWFNHQL